MGILNKRNAVLGWTAWQVAKRVGKRKAKQAVPGRVDDTKRPNRGAILSALAALGGVVWFWRRRRGENNDLG
jgi:hypothetical protein